MAENTKKLPSWFEEEKNGRVEEAVRQKRTDADAPVVNKPRMAPDGKIRIESEPSLPEDMRSNPTPLILVAAAVIFLGAFLWFVFLRTPESEMPARPDVPASPERAEDPFSGAADRDSGVVFGGLEMRDGEATLSGAGLEWSGIVTEKEGGGETVTLEGPTAAQLERGFDLGSSSIETGVYAVAQRSGEVLHVSTHTLRPSEEDGEITLGTVYALDGGEQTGYAYYLDERGDSAEEITRTYVIPGEKSYSVSFEAEPGTFVPLLVGWRGFEGGGSQDTRQQQGG